MRPVWICGSARTHQNPTRTSPEPHLLVSLVPAGIWSRDIRFKSNLPLTEINKILKNLESKKLIKAVKSVAVSSETRPEGVQGPLETTRVLWRPPGSSGDHQGPLETTRVLWRPPGLAPDPPGASGPGAGLFE